MHPNDDSPAPSESERLLSEHGPNLLAEARQILLRDPMAKLAGLIIMPDAPDAAAIHAFATPFPACPLPPGVWVGLVPRSYVEALLRARTGPDHWLEQGWRRQSMLPIVVSTRRGHQFGFFSLATGKTEM